MIFINQIISLNNFTSIICNGLANGVGLAKETILNDGSAMALA